MKRFGRVISIKGKKARVMVQKHSACDKCGRCSDNARIVTVRNSAGAKEGDIVTLEMKGSSLSVAAVMIYLIPLLGVVVGYLLGVYLGFNQEWIRIIFGAALFTLSFWLARRVGQANQEAYDVKMTGIAKRK